VIFDEERIFDRKKTHPENQLIIHMDDQVERIKLNPPQVKNAEILEVDEEVLCPDSRAKLGLGV
jgi:hypothetical protein